MSKSSLTPEGRRRLAEHMHIRRVDDAGGLQDLINVGLRAAREKFEGDNNVMRRPEVAAKIRGKKNGMADPATKAKHRAAVIAYHAKRKAARDA